MSSRDHYVTATWVLGGAAVAAGVTGLLLYRFDEPSAESLRIAPVTTPTSAGVVVMGRF